MLWWEVRFSGAEIEEKAAELFEFGVAGVETVSADVVKVFLKGSQEDLQALCKHADTIGLKKISSEEIKNQNWVQQCQEIWEPVIVDKVVLLPVIDEASDKQPSAASLSGSSLQIKLIPGFGFGTGHHESTRLALKLMQSRAISEMKPQRILDVGTGNAVLSLVARGLFGARVQALDNDETALVNARENLEINSKLAPIEFYSGLLDHRFGKYQLILANIYAEILCGYEEHFYRHLETGGYLIMAGVNRDTVPEVYEKFRSERWTKVAEIEENSWLGLLYSKA